MVKDVATVKDVKWNGEELVVDESTVSRHNAHKKEKVSEFSDLSKAIPLEDITQHDDGESSEEQEGTVTHVTEHHTKEEWEGDNGDRHWVGLLVSGDTVSIDNQLPWHAELVALEEGWLWNVVALVQHDLGGSLTGQLLSDLVLLLKRCPEVADEALVLPLHHVEGLVKSLFLGEEHLVDVNGRGLTLLLIVVRVRNLVEVDELLLQEVSGSVIHIHGVLDRVLDLLDLAWDGGNLWELVSVSGEGVTDFLDLLSNVLTVPEDDDVHGSLGLDLAIFDVFVGLHE